jgi:NAD(P)-dependent dehydrogenase (short-subunit alcohol dehydrogenase family)
MSDAILRLKVSDHIALVTLTRPPVNVIALSVVPTEGRAKHRTEEKDQRRIARTPVGRLGTVEDIAKAICFLATDQASFVTDQVLAVDGGLSAYGGRDFRS